MAKVTLAKALKVKNVLAGEIAKLKAYIPGKNVHDSRNKPQLDNNELVGKLLTLTTDLVKVKTAIAVANVGLYETIFNKAECAGMIEFFGSIPTEEGTSNMYGNDREITTVAQIKISVVNEMLEKAQQEINKCQDFLDTANHTILVEIPDHLVK